LPCFEHLGGGGPLFVFAQCSIFLSSRDFVQGEGEKEGDGKGEALPSENRVGNEIPLSRKFPASTR